MSTAGDYDDYPNFCGVCNRQLAGDQDERTCPGGHTPEEIAAYEEWRSGGEQHTEDCQEFTDYDGSAACSCGGMMCDSGFSAGPAHDPYGTSCEYIRRDHPKTEDGRHLLHRGPDPMIDGEQIEWTGGGTCAGDPLPHTVVRHLAACPQAEAPVADDEMWEHMRTVHGWLMGGFERDDYYTLRNLHRVTLMNARLDAEAQARQATAAAN